MGQMEHGLKMAPVAGEALWWKQKTVVMVLEQQQEPGVPAVPERLLTMTEVVEVVEVLMVQLRLEVVEEGQLDLLELVKTEIMVPVRLE